MLKKNLSLRFKTSSLKTEYGQSVTITSGIINIYRSLFVSLKQSHLPSTEQHTALSEMKASSFGQLLDTEICVDEIENAVKNVKLGKSGGPDGLSPKLIVFGGELLKIWLNKPLTAFTLKRFPETRPVCS